MKARGAPRWHLVRFSGGAFASDAADLIVALEASYQDAGEPPEAQVFMSRHTLDHCTLLMSPEMSRMAPEVLIQFDAVACAAPGDLTNFAPLML